MNMIKKEEFGLKNQEEEKELSVDLIASTVSLLTIAGISAAIIAAIFVNCNSQTIDKATMLLTAIGSLVGGGKYTGFLLCFVVDLIALAFCELYRRAIVYFTKR